MGVKHSLEVARILNQVLPKDEPPASETAGSEPGEAESEESHDD